MRATSATASTKSDASNNNLEPAVQRIPQERKPIPKELLNREDFYWVNYEEPHLRRKYEILQKYPQIEKLFGVDYNTKYQVIAFVLIHLFICYLVKDQPWYIFVPTAWLIGGAFIQSLTVAIHEITHGMCFDKLEHNYYFAMFANLPMGIPSAMTFKRYHSDHHWYLGVPLYDVDITTRLEGKYVRSKFLKLIHMIFIGLVYGVKPLLVAPRSPNTWELLNMAVSFSFDGLLVYFWGYRALIFCVLSSLLGLGLHPLSGHFLSEHWLTEPGQETYSYYGPANWFMFNVGYHNEHHDFPRIPCSKLPLLRKIAPEFYDTLGYYESWSAVVYNYIMTDGYNPFVRQVRTIDVHKKARKEWFNRGFTEHACSNEADQQ
ncbi:hypothetical protein FDP41_010570 [Naegleria fowleri]|uniref:Sphingolipid delta4-desaturase N-terminal domain-containing protein n=1 Tax=Naegleria fowleri TaxID=5763 RepID=A0A6A5CDS2_NAEFO|nr:uncharacterized protein FDP41_010570 [Naegleria fowleri]KAF0983505.1 hypothetical protein FDP41_010570 [Naegleria fowleri]